MLINGVPGHIRYNQTCCRVRIMLACAGRINITVHAQVCFFLQTVATSCVLTAVPWTPPRVAANALESTRGPPAPRVSSDIIRMTSWFVNPFQSYRPFVGGIHWHFSSQNLCHKHVNRVHSTSSESYLSHISWRFSPQNVCHSHVNRVQFTLPDPKAVSISGGISYYLSQVNSPHKGQWHRALICARPNGWVNNREAGDLRRHRIHYDVIMFIDYHMLNLSRFPSTENCKPDPDYCGKPQPMGFEKFHCTQWTNVPDECPNMCGLCWGIARMDKQQKHHRSGSNKIWDAIVKFCLHSWRHHRFIPKHMNTVYFKMLTIYIYIYEDLYARSRYLIFRQFSVNQI